jgi:type IV pilus assembly protein PilC
VEFRCRIASPSGEISEGVYAADSEARLRHDFEEKNLYVLSLQPKGSIAGLSFTLPQRAAIPSREFLIFNQELATLLKAGMPLVQSLDLLKRRVESPVFRGVLDDVYERVRSGTALSDAFGAHESHLPSVYTASLLAGERSGSLDTVLRRFVEYSKIIATIKRKMISALVYPAILTVLALVLVTVIVVFVVPAFSSFYTSFGAAELPLVTRIIVGFSDFVRGQFLLLIVAVPLLIAGLLAWMRQPAQKARFDRAVLKLPMLGDVAQKFSTSQMSRTLATLLGGGLPLVHALDIASRSMANQHMAKQLAIVTTRVKEGESFSAALHARKVFPEVAVKMAEVGESTGALQEMLNTVADFYDEEISTKMERFVTLVEPTLLVIMGIVIAGLLISLYMPIFQVSSVLSGPGLVP